jgi:hypothetical protein
MAAQKTTADFDFIGKFATRHRLDDPVSSDPSGLGSSDASRTWFNTTSGLWKYWDGTAAIDPRARASHTGTQVSSTISDLAATVQAYSLSLFAGPTADLAIGHKLTGVTDPTNPQDASTKNYVDTQLAGVATGLILKGAVVCAVTTNISLSSPGATIDGVTMSGTPTILLTGQTTQSQNGPYVWSGASSALVRAANWDTSGEAVLGSFWLVEQGTNANNVAICTNTSAITLGTTSLTFSFNTSGSSGVTGSSSILISSGVISVIVGTGLIGDATHAVVPDFAIVGRKVTGVVPATTTGIVTVAGAVITINHGLNNWAPSVVLAAYSTPASGYATGDLPFAVPSVVDANNVSITLPAAPASNNWAYTVLG